MNDEQKCAHCGGCGCFACLRSKPEADGGKGEAVAPVGKVLSESEMGIAFDRSRGGNVVWFGTPQPGFLYTAPQAECAPRDPVDGLSDAERCEIVECLTPGLARHVLDKFAECAPREAQPDELIDELEPCPFCGYEAEHIHVFAGEEIVRCVNEGCPVRPGVTRDDPQDAYALWNQRAAPTPERADTAGANISEEELSKLLPGSYYMDPPDGGSVTILEQLRRMADDAAKYRERADADAAVALDDDGLCELANKYALGNIRLDRLRGFVNHVAIAQSAERADAEKDAALTDDAILEIASDFSEWTVEGYAVFNKVEFARAILAANKEPQP